MKQISLFLAVLAVILGCSRAQEVVAPQKGTVSGTVTDSGVAVKDALVLLLKASSIESGDVLKNASKTNAQGYYKVWLVEPGSYYVVAVRDEDGNLKYDPDTDRVGWYGHESHGAVVPDSVTVSEGEDVTGVDITNLYGG